MTEQTNADILPHYFAGECDPEERARVDAWGQANPGELDRARAAWFAAGGNTVIPSVEAAQAFAKEMGRLVREDTAKRTVSQGSWMSPVVGLTMLAAVILTMKYAQTIISNHRPASGALVYTTSQGQRLNVTLPDGSNASLAPESRITIDNRNVALKGEAVFTVESHSGEPFTVRAGGVTTHVLGTRFGIRVYKDSIRVAVADGRVSVASAVVSSGDVAVVHGETARLTRGAEVASLLSWTQGTLDFDEAPLSVIIPELERWFGVKVIVADPTLLNRRVTVSLDATQPERSVDLLASLVQARVTRNGRSITFGSLK